MKYFKNLNLTIAILTFCTITMFASFAKADFWSWTNPMRGPDQNINTLIITGNYVPSRILAELIQSNNRQPILLIPSSNSKNQSIFFMPPQKSAAALELKQSELSRFISFVGAKQVIVLGDNKYVPEKFVKLIPTDQTIWIVKANHWRSIAASTGKLLNLSNLASDYDKLLDQATLNNQYIPTEQNSTDETAKVSSTEDPAAADHSIQPLDSNSNLDTNEPNIQQQATPADLSQPQIIDASQK